MDLPTILKAVEIVGEATPAALRLLDGFAAIARGETQAELQRRYAAARALSDDLHQRMQDGFKG